MAGKYGYKPDGDRYWNVRDSEGQFARGAGMASAVAKVSDLKLPPITGDYSASEKKNLRSRRRKLGQKMIDKGWTKRDIEEALGSNPKIWPDAKDVSYKTNFNQAAKASDPKPTMPAGSVSKAPEVKKKAPEPASADKPLASPNKVPGVGAAALTVKDLKLPTIEGDDLTAQQKKNLRSQRRKLAQKMIDSGWTEDQILDKLSSDPKTWPPLKYVKHLTPDDSPQAKTKVTPDKALVNPLGAANILKSTSGMAQAGLTLHLTLSKMDDGTASPAEVKMRLGQMDKFKLNANYLNDPQDRADALAALSQIERGLQDYLKAPPKGGANQPATELEKLAQGVEAGAKAFNAEKAKPATDSVMEGLVGKAGLNFIQEAENALSRPSITTDQLQYHFDKVSFMLNRLEDPKLLLDSEEAKKRIRKLYIAYKSIVGESAIPKFLQNNELLRGI